MKRGKTMFGRRQGITSIPARSLSIKGQSFIRLVATLMMFSGVLAGLAHPAAARTEPDRIDGNTYSGLDYDWSLSWDDSVWTDPYEVHRDGSEYIMLATVDDPFASARVDATDMFNGDVDDCVSGWDDVLRADRSMRHFKETALDAGIELT